MAARLLGPDWPGIAALLALVLLAATPVASGRPWQNWGAWGLGGPSSSRLTFDWMLNFPSLLNPRAGPDGLIRLLQPQWSL